MRKLLYVMAMAIGMMLGPMQGYAETVYRKTAEAVAQAFFNEAAGLVTPPPKLVYNGKRLTTANLFIPFYVFNSPSGGFVIVSAENKAFPILGFNLSKGFDADALGEYEKALLRSYARDIEMIRYDSDVPYEAIEAWQDIPSYISKLVKAYPQVNSLSMSRNQADGVIDALFASDRYIQTASDLFTPSQWSDEMSAMLKRDGDVALGLVDGDRILPLVAYGSKGDYWRLLLDGENDSFYRLFATEILSFGQLADIVNAAEIVPPQEEEPFSFYEDFITETRSENESREHEHESRLNVIEPRLVAMGGGHFRVDLPSEIVMSRIYNLNGSMIRLQRYSDVSSAFVDLGGQPSGFYFVVVNDVEGRPYGFKIYR